MTVIKPEKEILIDLYENKKMSMKDISVKLGISVGSIHKYIHDYGIAIRPVGSWIVGKHLTEVTKDKIRKANTGRIFSDDTLRKMSDAKNKGGIGHKKKSADGYVKIYFPDHPYSSKDGYIMEHILVMECLIGRYIKDDEVVHHKNGIRDDNRKENLELMTFKEHSAYHLKQRIDNNEIKYHTRPIINLTTGDIFHSAREAAKIYGVAPTNITRACRDHNRSCKNCKWDYYESEVEE